MAQFLVTGLPNFVGLELRRFLRRQYDGFATRQT